VSGLLPTLRTARLQLRALGADDAEFVHRQLNTPGWLRFIGDRGVRSIADAARYIEERVIAQYRAYGFGMYVLERGPAEPLGLCGLVQREGLPQPDLGFALLEHCWGHGYAFEAAQAVLAHARERLAIPRVLAIVDPDNERSARLLEKLGFRREGTIRLAPESTPLLLFCNDLLAA
jgi:ribosomal-protein-alanine N-acetyltransferase